MNNLDSFAKHQYLSIETFRKNGVGVKTPVWFVELKDQLCFVTEPHSGKVKRMRNNPSVRVAPCKMNGTPLAEFQPATIHFMQGNEIKEIEKLYNKKYRLMKFLFELPRLFNKKHEQAFIAITLE